MAQQSDVCHVVEDEVLGAPAVEPPHGVVVGGEEGELPVQEGLMQPLQLEDLGKL